MRAVTLDGFGTFSSVKAMLLLASFLGFAALGQTILILLGHVDLAIPGFVGLGNVLTAILVGQDHWPFAVAAAFILVGAALTGSISGLICHRFRVQSLVVTLGMNFVLAGVIGVVAAHDITGTAPGWLTALATVRSKTFGLDVPPLVVLWAVVAVGASLVLRHTLAGRRIYVTGSNAAAADLALVKTGRVVVGAFALSGVSAAVTGILLTGFSGSADTGAGSPYLFSSFTVVLIGGTSIWGARGDYWRTVIGSIMLIVITTVLLAKGYSSADQQILQGVVILVVVFMYGREERLRDRV